MDKISRGINSVDVTIVDDLSEVIDFRAYSMMIITLPDEWTAASIGFKVCGTESGTFLPLYDDTGTLLEVTVSVDKAFVCPAEIAPATYVRLWSQTAGSSVNQSGDRAVSVILKS